MPRATIVGRPDEKQAFSNHYYDPPHDVTEALLSTANSNVNNQKLGELSFNYFRPTFPYV